MTFVYKQRRTWRYIYITIPTKVYIYIYIYIYICLCARKLVYKCRLKSRYVYTFRSITFLFSFGAAVLLMGKNCRFRRSIDLRDEFITLRFFEYIIIFIFSQNIFFWWTNFLRSLTFIVKGEFFFHLAQLSFFFFETENKNRTWIMEKERASTI